MMFSDLGDAHAAENAIAEEVAKKMFDHGKGYYRADAVDGSMTATPKLERPFTDDSKRLKDVVSRLETLEARHAVAPGGGTQRLVSLDLDKTSSINVDEILAIFNKHVKIRDLCSAKLVDLKLRRGMLHGLLDTFDDDRDFRASVDGVVAEKMRALDADAVDTERVLETVEKRMRTFRDVVSVLATHVDVEESTTTSCYSSTSEDDDEASSSSSSEDEHKIRK